MLELLAPNDPTPVTRPDNVHEPEAGGVGWGALGALSVALLLLALVVPNEIGVVMAAIGLAGLMVFRVAAMYGGWAPRGVHVAEQRMPPEESDRSIAPGLRSWTPPPRRAPTLSRLRRRVS